MADTTMVAIDASARYFPSLELAQKVFGLEQSLKAGTDSSSARTEILAAIELDEMAPFYAKCCEKYGWAMDDSKFGAMKESNAKALEEIEAKLQEAITSAGDTEVLDAMFSKAQHFCKIGGWTDAVAAYDAILAKEKTSTGKKIDATMAQTRIALFDLDMPKTKELLESSKRLVEKGGDWDRKNRLKVYEAVYLMAVRDIGKASELLQSCIATFTCVEICSYNQFMFYALLTSIMTLPRIALKKKIVADPQVISVIRDVPHMQQFLHSIYDCDYGAFLQTLLLIHPRIVGDRYLGPHATYIVREYRILAYSQFLEAYRSVMMSSMAASFGMTLPLLDVELSRFIAAGRISAKIDKVGDIVETSRPDKKNAQFSEIIKKGDVLLNHVQKLVRTIEQ